MYLCFRTTFLLASISPDIRELKSALTRSKWTLSRMVRHFSVLQSALPTAHISLVPLNCLPSLPTGSPPFLLLERASCENTARDPRAYKRLRIEARKVTHCIQVSYNWGSPRCNSSIYTSG